MRAETACCEAWSTLSKTLSCPVTGSCWQCGNNTPRGLENTMARAELTESPALIVLLPLPSHQWRSEGRKPQESPRPGRRHQKRSVRREEEQEGCTMA